VEFGEDGEHVETVATSTCEWLRVVLNASLVGVGMASHCCLAAAAGGGGGENSKHIFPSVVKQKVFTVH
jgi:hypothetical protein